MIVVDASALADVVTPTELGLRVGPHLSGERAHAPDLVDVEVASAIRGRVIAGEMSAEAGTSALADALAFNVIRHPTRMYLPRGWELRDDFSIYDAVYVALAEALGASLLSTDKRLARGVATHTTVRHVGL